MKKTKEKAGKYKCDACAYYMNLNEYFYNSTGNTYVLGGLGSLLGMCMHLKSSYYNNIVTNIKESCSCYSKNKKLENEYCRTILYGGTQKQIEKQLSCVHKWHGPCMDDTSRYFKCTKCFCIERNMTEEEYYNKVGIYNV